MSQKDHQLYQYLIKLAGPINIEECGFMVVDTPDDRDIKEEEKEEEKPGITRTIKSVKCLIRKMESKWWSDHIYEIRPKISDNHKDSKKDEKDEKSSVTETKMIDYIYKDGERNEELFEFKEKIFLTELFVNKLDEYLTKQEKEPKSKKVNIIIIFFSFTINKITDSLN